VQWTMGSKEHWYVLYCQVAIVTSAKRVAKHLQQEETPFFALKIMIIDNHLLEQWF